MLPASENNEICDPFAGLRFPLTGWLDIFCQLLQQSRGLTQILDTHKEINRSKVSIGYFWFVADSSPFGPLCREGTLILRDSENMKKNYSISSQSFPSNFLIKRLSFMSIFTGISFIICLLWSKQQTKHISNGIRPSIV